MELASLDPKLGVVFYTLSASKEENGRPNIERRDVCLQCHQGPSTLGVPGMFIGSVYPDSSGSPSRQGAIVTDHRTAFEDRWGGWYVNAKSGEQRDRANSIAPNPAEPETLANEGKQNLPNLTRQFSPAGYLAPVSDIVALMTFEHQTQALNFITRLGWESRIAAHDGGKTIQLKRRSRTTSRHWRPTCCLPKKRRLKNPLRVSRVSVQLFSTAARGTERTLSSRLRPAHTALPISAELCDLQPGVRRSRRSIRERLYRQLYDALTGRTPGLNMERVSAADRLAILEIVADTKSGLPAYWRP